jgi:uncharacterized protein involved in response to NO
MEKAMSDAAPAVKARSPAPRGIASTGPVILSYGFRPFFLLAGIFAFVAMAGWIAALAFGWAIGGAYGALNWHAHEMLFGYTAAALAGFMLTAIPNWTGRLPVSGGPLLALVLLWLAGRLAMAIADVLGPVASAAIDTLFMPTLAVIALREIVAGKNWKNLKILGGLFGLSFANVGFHVSALTAGQALEASRLTVGVYVILIALIGGRIVPSFTRNYLAKAKSPKLPKPFATFDIVAIAALVPALLAWVFAGETIVAALLAFAAAVLQAYRLARWQGWRTVDEPLLLVMHAAYGFIPVGLVAVGLSELRLLSGPSALHVLTVGAVGLMTFAVMTRASLGHTGRPLKASAIISVAYLALALSAVLRPFAEIIPEHYHSILTISATAWLVAFGLFLYEYGPILVSKVPKNREPSAR